jgi:DNA-binding NarL/FixJ family response regulator
MARSAVVADADERALEGMRDALEAGGLRVAATAATGEEAVAAVLAERPDVALLSAALPGDAIAAARRIAREGGGTRVVLIGPPPSDAQLLDALRAGADGYLLRDTDPDRLPLALAGALEGEAPIPRTLVTRLVEELRAGERRRAPVTGPGGEALSAREVEVVALLGDGLPTSAVAAELGLSDVTVRRHVSSAIAKLGVADRAAAIAAVRAALG